MMRAEMDKLLEYLPLLEQPGVLSSTEGHSDAIKQFFDLAAQACWRDVDYDPAEAGRMLEDDSTIEDASLEEIRTMLTYCVRGEKFTPGHWDHVLSSGKVVKLLRRLRELRQTIAPSASRAADDAVVSQ